MKPINRAQGLAPVLLLALLFAQLGGCQSEPSGASTIPLEPASGRINELAWLTGTWRDPMGERLLEEQWSVPAAGSIAAVVRFFAGSQTQIVELLAVREMTDGYEMVINQWSGNMQPLSPAPQTMALDQLGERSVSFSSASPGGMKRLHYASPNDSTLTIAVDMTEGTQFNLELRRVDD